jgi:hypothetical protein
MRGKVICKNNFSREEGQPIHGLNSWFVLINNLGLVGVIYGSLLRRVLIILSQICKISCVTNVASLLVKQQQCNMHYSVYFQISLSDESSVFLRNVTLATSGDYKCQVSGEGPLFSTVSQTKTLKVAGT